MLFWSLFHAAFFHLNEVLKVADSYAYLQMARFLENLSPTGLGSGWFGFVYSIPLAIWNIFFTNEILSWQLINIMLLNISALLIYSIGTKILHSYFLYIPIILWYLSPTFLHFNIHILSENIYIPLFLGLFILTQKFMQTPQAKYAIGMACVLWLMYLTRAEAFIYIGSIGIISLSLAVQKKLSVRQFLSFGAFFFLTFFLFIFPYLFHLHSLTGEWWLTNKWASNLRQAQLRGIKKMDDAGFEQAVAELTPDKTQLIAWFAGGMQYTRPQIEGSLIEFIIGDPVAFIQRVLQNWKKVLSRNLPEIFLGKSPELYFSEDARFSHLWFLLFCLSPLLLLCFGAFRLLRRHSSFMLTYGAFFLPAFLFFSLFFTLNRYFLIFLPLMLLLWSFWLQEIWSKKKNIHIFLTLFLCINIVSIYLLSSSVYYQGESGKDSYYALKKEAGEWLKHHCESENICTSWYAQLKIMERFPIVTYYSGTKTRYITPYTNDIQDIYSYGNYNNIDILVVDTMDFLTYRPALAEYLEKTPENFIFLHEFKNQENQKVILYWLQK
jgi:hypothetical protein